MIEEQSMNKSRAVIITLLMCVVAAAFSTFSVEGPVSIRPVSARAHDFQIEPDPIPTIPYTPEPSIRVKMNALDNNGAASRDTLCGKEDGRFLYGCTAFCVDSGVDPDRCNREQRLAYPYGEDSVPWLDIEGDYLPDVLSQEMGPDFEDVSLLAGAIAMRSYVLQLFEWLEDHTINNSTQYQAFIPYKFNTYQPASPGIACGVPDPLLDEKQRRICNAIAPRYYLSPDYNDYPARANHIGDILGNTETAYDKEGNIEKPYLIGVNDPISFSCYAYTVNEDQRYGMSQSGANRWVRGNQCYLDSYGSEPWSVRWTTAEQILFHYFTRVQLRDASNGKQILSPDWRWNPLRIEWGTPDNQPPVMVAGRTSTFKIEIQNTGIDTWSCDFEGEIPIPREYYRLRYRWLTSDAAIITTGEGVPVCDLEPGSSTSVELPVWIPANLPGEYILRLDMYHTSTYFWFSDGGWPPYDVPVRIIPPPNPTPTATSCGNDC
jgi:hypothetical protein